MRFACLMHMRNMHAQLSSGARNQIFGLEPSPTSIFVCVSIEGYDETAHMSQFIIHVSHTNPSE